MAFNLWEAEFLCDIDDKNTITLKLYTKNSINKTNKKWAFIDSDNNIDKAKQKREWKWKEMHSKKLDR